MTEHNFENHISSFYELCKNLGRIQLGEQKNLDINLKSDNTPVTNIDLYSSEIIVRHISEYFENDIIISEESHTNNYGNPSYWLVDPIDGTKNYIEGGKEFCVCISYIKNNFPVFGIIYIPTKDQFYYGIKDKGAFLIDDKSLKPKKIINTNTQNNIYVSSTIRKSLLDMLKTNFTNSNLVYMLSLLLLIGFCVGYFYLHKFRPRSQKEMIYVSVFVGIYIVILYLANFQQELLHKLFKQIYDIQNKPLYDLSDFSKPELKKAYTA